MVKGLEAPTKIIGPVIWEDDSEGIHWQLEQLPVPRRVGAGDRPYRLWCDGYPATGGQWHYTIKGAKWEATRRTNHNLHNDIARSHARIMDLERQLSEARNDLSV